MVPVYKKNYLVSFIRPNPDLYGKVHVQALIYTYPLAVFSVLVLV